MPGPTLWLTTLYRFPIPPEIDGSKLISGSFRRAALDHLEAAFQHGDLTVESYERRRGFLMVALYVSDLRAWTDDLPAVHSHDPAKVAATAILVVAGLLTLLAIALALSY